MKIERAFVTLQREHERFDRVNVEMRGGLVHEQQVWRIDEKLDQIEPALFAAAQNGGLLENVVLAEQERAENAARLVLRAAAARWRSLPRARCVRDRACRRDAG